MKASFSKCCRVLLNRCSTFHRDDVLKKLFVQWLFFIPWSFYSFWATGLQLSKKIWTRPNSRRDTQAQKFIIVEIFYSCMTVWPVKPVYRSLNCSDECFDSNKKLAHINQLTLGFFLTIAGARNTNFLRLEVLSLLPLLLAFGLNFTRVSLFGSRSSGTSIAFSTPEYTSGTFMSRLWIFNRDPKKNISQSMRKSKRTWANSRFKALRVPTCHRLCKTSE